MEKEYFCQELLDYEFENQRALRIKENNRNKMIKIIQIFTLKFSMLLRCSQMQSTAMSSPFALGHLFSATFCDFLLECICRE